MKPFIDNKGTCFMTQDELEKGVVKGVQQHGVHGAGDEHQ